MKLIVACPAGLLGSLPLLVWPSHEYLPDYAAALKRRWLSDFVRDSASGNWELMNYQYTFTLREHLDWVRKNEACMYEDFLREKTAIMSETDWNHFLNDLDSRTAQFLKSLYSWGNKESESQLLETGLEFSD